MYQFQVLRSQALEVLKIMQKRNPAIELSSLTYVDGRLLATTLNENIDEDLIACAETVAFYVSSNLAKHLTKGEAKKILISGDRGNILVQGVGNLILTTVTKKNADIKKIVNNIEKYLEDLRKIDESYATILKKYYLPQESIISNSRPEELSVQT